MLSDDGLTLNNYWFLPAEDKKKYDSLAWDLVASPLIVQNYTSSRASMYLKENYFIGAKNFHSTVVAMVVLIISFRVNSERTGGSGGEKDTNKLNAIVSLHLADDSNNNSDDKKSQFDPLNLMIQMMEELVVTLCLLQMDLLLLVS